MSLEMKSLLKWPLVVALVLVVVRILLEQAGAPESVNMIFGVAWLYLVVTIVFAVRIVGSADPHPFKSLFKNVLAFAVITRLMVMPTYWLAYLLQWTAPRFSAQGGGVVGEGISPLFGYVVIPVRNALIWTVMATLVGMILGTVTLLIRRSRTAAASPAS